jgi:hypothetical protein
MQTPKSMLGLRMKIRSDCGVARGKGLAPQYQMKQIGAKWNADAKNSRSGTTQDLICRARDDPGFADSAEN